MGPAPDPSDSAVPDPAPAVGRDPTAAARATNRRHWDEAAVLHRTSSFYDLDGFVRGERDCLRPFELDEVGMDVAGCDLVHLQCHLATDTLSWARHGARVTGLDFSAEALAAATGLAARCGLDATFVRADVYDAVAALGASRFDVVYTGVGALNWLDDLDRWARAVAGLLRPGGVLYLHEIHPVVGAVVEDGRTVTDDMVEGEFRRWDEPGTGTYAVPEARLEHTATWERNHALSEVVTAVLDVGLRLELLREHAVTDAPWPWLERGQDGLYRTPSGAPRIPLSYSLRARFPAAV